ncbi:MAG: hypothetical protein ACM3JI_05845, partial [Anaerolineae bacterium]
MRKKLKRGSGGKAKRRLGFVIFIGFLGFLFFSRHLLIVKGVEIAWRLNFPEEAEYQKIEWAQDRVLISGISFKKEETEIRVDAIELAGFWDFKSFSFCPSLLAVHPEISFAKSASWEGMKGGFPNLLSLSFLSWDLKVQCGVLNLAQGEKNQRLYFAMDRAENQKGLHYLTFSYDPDPTNWPMMRIDLENKGDEWCFDIQTDPIECSKLLDPLCFFTSTIPLEWEKLQGELQIEGRGIVGKNFEYALAARLEARDLAVANAGLGIQAKLKHFELELSRPSSPMENLQTHSSQPFWKRFEARGLVEEGSFALNGSCEESSWKFEGVNGSFMLSPASDPDFDLEALLCHGGKEYPLKADGRGGTAEDGALWLDLQIASDPSLVLLSISIREQVNHIARLHLEKIGPDEMFLMQEIARTWQQKISVNSFKDTWLTHFIQTALVEGSLTLDLTYSSSKDSNPSLEIALLDAAYLKLVDHEKSCTVSLDNLSFRCRLAQLENKEWAFSELTADLKGGGVSSALDKSRSFEGRNIDFRLDLGPKASDEGSWLKGVFCGVDLSTHFSFEKTRESLFVVGRGLIASDPLEFGCDLKAASLEFERGWFHIPTLSTTTSLQLCKEFVLPFILEGDLGLSASLDEGMFRIQVQGEKGLSLENEEVFLKMQTLGEGGIGLCLNLQTRTWQGTIPLKMGSLSEKRTGLAMTDLQGIIKSDGLHFFSEHLIANFQDLHLASAFDFFVVDFQTFDLELRMKELSGSARTCLELSKRFVDLSKLPAIETGSFFGKDPLHLLCRITPQQVEVDLDVDLNIENVSLSVHPSLSIK